MNNNLLDDHPKRQSNVQRAGFGIRLGAYLLDYIFVLILSFAIAFLAMFLLIGNNPALFENLGTDEENALVNQVILGIGVAATLYTLMEAFTGASLGKMILGLRIRQVGGEAAPTGSLLLRWLLKNLSMPLVFLHEISKIPIFDTLSGLAGFFVLISCLMALRDTKQALHDQVTNTIVVKK